MPAGVTEGPLRHLCLLFPVFRAKFTHLGSGSPHFSIAHFGKLGVQLLSVVWPTVPIEYDFGFRTIGDLLIEIVKHGSNRRTEYPFPVQGAPLGSSTAVGIKPVHSFLSGE